MHTLCDVQWVFPDRGKIPMTTRHIPNSEVHVFLGDVPNSEVHAFLERDVPNLEFKQQTEGVKVHPH